jgi:hypothetical protein
MPPSLDGARRSRRQGVEPATWASRPGSTGVSRTPCGRSSRRHGTRQARRDGVRPPRRAPHAVGQAQGSIRAGSTWGVDLDRETLFDRVPHDGWRSRVRRRGPERRVVTRIHRVRNAGVRTLAGRVAPTVEGTPGGPRVPRRANRRLDERDQAREQRGHRFARAADEANLDGRSRQAGARVMARVTRVLERTRRSTVNEATSAVDRPWNRPGRGVTGTRCQPNRRPVRETALTAVQATGRAMTGRTRVGPSGRSGRNGASGCGGGGRSSALPRGAPRVATGIQGSGGGGGATPGRHGAGGETGRYEHAAWAGRWPGTRSSRPTARGGCVSAPRGRWRDRRALSRCEGSQACSGLDPATASAEPPDP